MCMAGLRGAAIRYWRELPARTGYRSCQDPVPSGTRRVWHWDTVRCRCGDRGRLLKAGQRDAGNARFFEPVTKRIIGSAFMVVDKIVRWVIETVYENALAHAMRESGLGVLRHVHVTRCRNHARATAEPLCTLTRCGCAKVEIRQSPPVFEASTIPVIPTYRLHLPQKNKVLPGFFRNESQMLGEGWPSASTTSCSIASSRRAGNHRGIPWPMKTMRVV